MSPTPAPSGPLHSLSSELALPTEALATFRRAIRAETSAGLAARILNEVGLEAGQAYQERFRREIGSDPAELRASSFWDRLGEFLGARGWGRLEVDRVHPAMGAIRSPDWAEATLDGGETNPSCHYSESFLQHLLREAAGAPITVLEVACRSRGDEECVFLYGSALAMEAVRERLSSGSTLDQALAGL